MKSLDRHILKNIMVPGFLAFGVITFLGIASEIRTFTEDIPQGFFTFKDFFRLIFFMFPQMVPLLIPVSFLLGILFAFGRMAQQGEIAAMQASGISLKRITLPVIIAGILLSIFAFLIQDFGQPWGVKRAYYIMFNELPQRATIDQLDEGELHQIEDQRIYFSRKNTDTHTLYDFDLIRPEINGTGIEFIHADEAQLAKSGDQYTLLLKGVYGKSQSGRYWSGDSATIPFPKPEQVFKTSYKRLSQNFIGLLTYEQEISILHESNQQAIYYDNLHRIRSELAKRISLPFAVIAIALVGAILGVQSKQRGKSSLFSMGFGVMVLYYTLLTVAQPTSSSDLYEYLLRAWIPNLALMGLGIAMLWKVDRV